MFKKLITIHPTDRYKYHCLSARKMENHESVFFVNSDCLKFGLQDSSINTDECMLQINPMVKLYLLKNGLKTHVIYACSTFC